MAIHQTLHTAGAVMEHRWGERLKVDLAVQVVRSADAQYSARLQDVSISGGYLLSAARLPQLSAVELQLQLSGMRVRLRGWLVRSDGEGCGVEWDQASPGINAVLTAARGLAPLELTGARRLRMPHRADLRARATLHN